MEQTLGWWLVVEAFGLVGLPLALVVFQRLPDRGYAFAKPLTILLTGFLFWFALSLHLLPNRPGTIVWCLGAIAVASLVLWRQRRVEMQQALAERLPVIIAVEVVFTVALFLAAHLRSYLPEIAGTEKPMDFLFLNTAARSRFYPPEDPWLSGFSVSYYYFGYVIQAMLAKLSATPMSVAFNIALAGTAALAATAAFGMGFNLVSLSRRVSLRSALLTGAVAALLLTVIGNLEGVLEFARANGIGSTSFFNSVGIANLASAGESAKLYPTERSSFWWWWRATRISPDGNSITEFPFFSFLLGDLHPHVMAIPFVLTSMAAGLALWLEKTPLSFAFWRERPGMLAVLAVLLGGLGFLNTWDLPAFGFLIALLVLARNRASAGADLGSALLNSAAFLLPLAVLAIVLYAPFYLSFHTQASGLEAVRSSATRPLHAVLFWLPLATLTVPMTAVRLADDPEARTATRIAATAVLPATLLFFWVSLLWIDHGSSAMVDAIKARGWNWLTTIFFATAFVSAALAYWRESEVSLEGESSSPPAPVFAFLATALLLVLGAELFFIKDVFSSRLNTVFKLYYQAWMLLAIAGAYGTFWLVREWRPQPATTADLLRGAWGAVATVVLAGALLYPVGATLSRTNGLEVPNRTLDGLAFARVENPEEIVALDWLSTRAGKDETIVEAVAGEYSAGGRVSSRTGVPAVLGWGGHELQWGRDGKMVGTREADVNQVYSTSSLAEAISILRKYNVSYVVVGNVEKSKYPASGLQKFSSGLDAVVSTSQATVYRVPLTDVPEGETGKEHQ